MNVPTGSIILVIAPTMRVIQATDQVKLNLTIEIDQQVKTGNVLLVDSPTSPAELLALNANCPKVSYMYFYVCGILYLCRHTVKLTDCQMLVDVLQWDV